MMPLLTAFVGLDKDALLVAPAGGTLLTLYEEVRLTCAELGLVHSTLGAAPQLAIEPNGVDLLWHLLAADTEGKLARLYPYQVSVRTGAKWFDLAEHGLLQLLPQA